MPFDRLTEVAVDSAGAVTVSTARKNGAENWKTIARLTHEAIRPHGAFNDLLVLVSGRTMEVFVNDQRVGPPVVFDQDVGPGHAHLAVSSGPAGVQTEFGRFTLWAADAVPNLAEQIALEQ
jgi:hypothetical protein